MTDQIAELENAFMHADDLVLCFPAMQFDLIFWVLHFPALGFGPAFSVLHLSAPQFGPSILGPAFSRYCYIVICHILVLQGESKKSRPPTSFIDIFAWAQSFCIKFCTFIGNIYPRTRGVQKVLQLDYKEE